MTFGDHENWVISNMQGLNVTILLSYKGLSFSLGHLQSLHDLDSKTNCILLSISELKAL